nr:putative disease resistance rpp8-like protein 4 [Quercus suber]
MIDEGSLPLLEELRIGPSPQLNEVPSSIHYLKSLKDLIFYEMPNEFVLSLQPDGGLDFGKVKDIPRVNFCLTCLQITNCITDRVIGCQRLKAFQVPNQRRYSSFLKQPNHQGLFYPCIAASVFTVVIVLYNLYQAYEPLELMMRKTDGKKKEKERAFFQRSCALVFLPETAIFPRLRGDGFIKESKDLGLTAHKLTVASDLRKEDKWQKAQSA